MFAVLVDHKSNILSLFFLTDAFSFVNHQFKQVLFSIHFKTASKVLVLKQFKGDFVSDTVHVVTWGGQVRINGQMESTPGAYAFAGDEAVFLATNSQKVDLGGNDPNTYDPFYGPGVSYVTPCNKKDPVKEVYEPLEKVIGHPYVDLRPNRCKEWQEAQKKKPEPRHPLGRDGKPLGHSASPSD